MDIKQIGKGLFSLLLLLLPTLTQANSLQQYSLYSKQLEQDRKYWVQLPKSYASSPERKYPVFYLLDGQSDMALVTGMLDRLQFSNVAAEMIVVGIDNPDRTWELAPTVNHDPRGPVGKGGGADKFLAFVEKELLPHIDKQFQTHNYRVISGHSIGGLFVLHTLQTKPDLFQAHFALSPAVWWSERTTSAKLKTFMSNSKELDNYLYINIGNEGGEMRQVYDDLIQYLQQNQPAGLRLQTDAFAQASHGLTSAAGMFNALHQMFLPLRMPTSELSNGAASIKQYFKRVSNQYGKEVQPQEWVVNSLGFDMLDQKRYGEAVDVFEYNQQLYPKSPYTHGSLAKAYALNQQKDKALKLIEQAISMLDKTVKGYQQTVTAAGAIKVFSFYGNKIWFYARLDKLSDMEKLNNSSSHNQQMTDALGELITSRKTFVQKFMPELSYQPVHPRLKPEQIKYVRKMRFYIKSNKVKLALETMQKFKGLFVEKQIQSLVWIYTGYVDEGLPYIDIFRFAKSAEDYHQYEDKVNQAIGYDTLSKLMQPFATTLAGEEVQEGKVLYW